MTKQDDSPPNGGARNDSEIAPEEMHKLQGTKPAMTPAAPLHAMVAEREAAARTRDHQQQAVRMASAIQTLIHGFDLLSAISALASEYARLTADTIGFEQGLQILLHARAEHAKDAARAKQRAEEQAAAKAKDGPGE